MIHTRFNAKIKTFRAVCARKYISTTIIDVLQSHGTLFQQFCPYTHEQNGVAERKHRHILETVRALLISSHVPRSFWAEAVLTSVNLINITPSVLAGKSLHSVSILLLRSIACSACLGVPVMSFLRSSAPSYLPDQLSVSYSGSVLSIRIH